VCGVAKQPTLLLCVGGRHVGDVRRHGAATRDAGHVVVDLPRRECAWLLDDSLATGVVVVCVVVVVLMLIA